MWDQFAQGAAQAIEEQQLSENISVYSIDISDEVIYRMGLPNSCWRSTAGLDSWLLGNMAVQCAWSWVQGADLGKYILLDPVLITQEFIRENDIKNVKQLVKCVPELQRAAVLKKYPFLKVSVPHELPTLALQPTIMANLPEQKPPEEIKPQEVEQTVPVVQSPTYKQQQYPYKRYKFTPPPNIPKPKSSPSTNTYRRPQSKNPLAQTLGIPFI